MALRALADTLISLLLAPPCAICGTVLRHPLDGAVCADCWRSIEPAPATFSLRNIPLAQAVGPYDGTLRDIIHALKYDGRRSIAPHLAALMSHHGAAVLRNAHVAVPVPLHFSRRRQRGFNQAEDLARGLGLPFARGLRRVRATRPQVDLPAAERRDNVRGAFALARRAPFFTGATIVLVDDVATTGATLEACAAVLRHAGAKEVRALTAARVVTGPLLTPRA